MLPLFESNDMVIFKKIRLYNINVGDIIVFQKNKKLIIHRAIFKTTKYLITKGDNNFDSDGKVYPRQIIGKVYKVKRGGHEFSPDNLYLIQSSIYFDKIIEVKKQLDEQNIDHLFLKGLPLHLYFEGSHPKRLYVDCDVLVNKSHSLKTYKVLEKLGYKQIGSSLSLIHKKLQKRHTEVSYIKLVNDLRVVFDIHNAPVFMMTQLSNLEALYSSKLIQRLSQEFLKHKKKIKVNGESFYILNDSHLITYLALHIFHHNFKGWNRYYFLDRVIRKIAQKNKGEKYQKIWKNALNLSDKYKLNNFIYPAFFLLKKLYKSPITNNFLSQLKQRSNHKPVLFLFKKPLQIFDGESRARAGINRFKLLFLLSPNPVWKKLIVFTYPQVVVTIIWLVVKFMFVKLKRISSRIFSFSQSRR